MTEQSLPAYLLVRLKVKNPEDYMNRYGMPVVGQLQAAGAELLSVSQEPDVVEGEWDSNWTVLIKFPSMTAAKKFYTSSEYAPYLSLRVNELTDGGSAVFLEGFDPATLGLS
jgi:uncharacterized protein (DUF1330 family)